ncbi:MAG: bifunctional phosphopantothenoylcysteine decarboxylase/phosphopantothenate--cysteine ligase CoaBC [Deltaproteobacteria bacterium]|nr:bifunctional phosphopantothenoylcysteine decarboxylase/phosphopantothenate--cysteine ligase CoaBC [Deltaproteobacteria bacterium]
MSLTGKHIVLGVTGGIAAYKAAYVARELLARGAEVRVAMTHTATKLIGPLTFTGLTGKPPVVDLWDPSYPGEVHVDLARWADAIVIAPTTANVIARLAHGLAEDPVSATVLCFDGPVLVAPAMHHRMWQHAATRANVATNEARGLAFVGPVFGKLASGEEGVGRMSEPLAIVDALEGLLAKRSSARDLEGRRVLVSAGPTHEALDPVRFLGNRSSGRMGWAIAERARDRGATVTIVAGPVSLVDPGGVEVVRVRSALEMEAAITSRREDADAIVMAAAVADFRPRALATEKIKKSEGEDAPSIELVRNPDILAGLGQWRLGRARARPFLVGFAVETTDLVAAAQKKLAKKKVDLVVANHASVAFEGDDNEAVLVREASVTPTGRLSKRALADRILDVLRDGTAREDPGAPKS